MKRVTWLTLLTLLSLVTVFSLSVMHNARSVPDARLKPCEEDVQKFCAKVKAGEGRMSKCLKDHEGDLSQACKSHLQAMREHMQEAREACRDDAKKLCKDVKPGHGNIVACLKSHENELSDACKEEMKQ